MTFNAILNPLPTFTDAKGSPITGGSIYVGVSGLDPETNPQACYWDAAGATPASQPLQVKGGFVVNGTTPAQFFTASPFSIRVYDAFGAVVYYKPSITEVDAATLAASSGSSLIGFLQAGTGATARTAQDKMREWVSVKDFGAVGDNSTDDTTAFTATITYALANGKAIRIPAGTYKITSRITATLPNSAVGPSATNYFSQLVMRGDGFARSIINCTASGFVKVVGSSQQHSVDFQDFAVTTGTSGGNTAIEMDCSAYPFFGEWTARSTIKLHFRGNDGINNVKYWGVGVNAIDWSNIDFSGSWFDGASTPNGIGVITAKSAGSYVCVFDFIGCHFRFLSEGYRYGTGSQTANFVGSFFAQNVTDVYAQAGGINHQGLSITNCECYKGAAGDGVYLACDVPNFVFSGNRWAIHAGYRGVAMDVTDMTTIVGNQFFPDVTPNTATAAIDVAGTVAGSHCIIDGNNFASTTIGARLKAGSTNVLYGVGNKHTGAMTPVTDAGTGNLIGALVNSPLGRIGYAPGTGGTVTQITSKSTGVTLNTPTGQITTHNASLASGTEVAFTVTCSAATVNDLVLIQCGSGNYSVRVTDQSAGSFVVRLKNLSGGPLTDAVVINYALVASVTA